MKKSNKKGQTNKKLKENFENMRNNEKSQWEQSKRERMFMNQNKNNQEFTENDTNEARFHRHHDDRFAPGHRGPHCNDQRRPHGRRMGSGRGMKVHRGSGKRQFVYEAQSLERGERCHAHRMEHRNQDWHRRGHHHRHQPSVQEQTTMLLYEKQRLERRLGHMKRRLHALNRELNAQIG